MRLFGEDKFGLGRRGILNAYFAEDSGDYGEYVGTDEETGNSYYVDDDGTITMTDADGNVLASETKDERPDDESGSDEWSEETYDTDTSRDYTFDSNGNLIDAHNGEKADTSNWGSVIGVGNQNGAVAGYTYGGTDRNGRPYYVDANGRKFSEEMLDNQIHNDYGGDAQAKVASNLGKAFNASTLSTGIKGYQNVAKEDPVGAQNLLANAVDGDRAAQVLLTAVTNVPVNGSTNDVLKAAGELQQEIANGKDLKTAYYAVNDKYGFTANEQMNKMLANSALNTVLMFGGPVLSQVAPGVAMRLTGRMGLHALGKSAQALSKSQAGRAALAQIANRAIQIGAKVGDVMDKASIAAIAADLGINAAQATQLVQDAIDSKANASKETSSSSSSELGEAKPEKEATPTETIKTSSTPTATAKASTEPTGKGWNVDLSKENGGLTLPGIQEPEGGWKGLPETPQEEEWTKVAEDDDREDSGSDTLETTTQDAPTGGVGRETFANPNNDAERKGWGVGEEDPNRADYDVDKWNRGMERVSTNVVSDEKCKSFIKKTFSNDPVLIKTVKIMKGRLDK